MSPADGDYRTFFKSCGADVIIEPGVWIEHPELWVVGDRVHLMQGLRVRGRAEVRLGNDVSFWPNGYIHGPGRLIVGHNVEFHPNNFLSLGGKNGLMEIGSRTHFAPGCALYGHGELRVGEGCAVAAHAVITTVGHDHRIPDRMLVDTSRSAPITLIRDIWIGANATVVSGVTVAEGCVIGAGAVVTRDTEPYGVYMGVPARLAYIRQGRGRRDASGA